MTHTNPNCRGVAPLRFPERFSEWSRWINEQGVAGGEGGLCPWCHGLTYIDMDGIWLHDDRDCRHTLLQAIEVKINGEEFLSAGQMMVLNTLDAMMAVANGQKVLIENMWGKPGWNAHRVTYWYGLHAVEMDGCSPADSESVVWDQEHEITVEELIKMMRFEHDPRSPGKALTLPGKEISA